MESFRIAKSHCQAPSLSASPSPVLLSLSYLSFSHVWGIRDLCGRSIVMNYAQKWPPVTECCRWTTQTNKFSPFVAFSASLRTNYIWVVLDNVFQGCHQLPVDVLPLFLQKVWVGFPHTSAKSPKIMSSQEANFLSFVQHFINATATSKKCI